MSPFSKRDTSMTKENKIDQSHSDENSCNNSLQLSPIINEKHINTVWCSTHPSVCKIEGTYMTNLCALIKMTTMKVLWPRLAITLHWIYSIINILSIFLHCEVLQMLPVLLTWGTWFDVVGKRWTWIEEKKWSRSDVTTVCVNNWNCAVRFIAWKQSTLKCNIPS